MEHFLWNIEIYVLFFSYHPQVALLRVCEMIVIVLNGWEWFVLGCVKIVHKTFSAPYSLENLIKQAYSLRFSPDPLISLSLCLVSEHILDLALGLSFSTADRVLAYL